MVRNWVRNDRYLLTAKKSGCSYCRKENKWQGRCVLNTSCRNYGCWKDCPLCKLLLKDRLKTAWHILTWNRGYIRQ